MIIKPKGTYDIYGSDAKYYNYINSLFSTIAEYYNYKFIRTPIFESSELFHRTVGETSDIVSKETYDFVDRGERNVTLRPEGTAGVVRSYIENKMYGEVNQPIKLYYSGPMYRYERPQAGRYREFTQFGVEVLGSDLPIQDAEVISLAYRVLEEMGIDNITVKINTLGDAESRVNYREALVKYLEPHINNLCPDCQNRFKTNPLRILDCKADKDSDILKNAPSILDYLNEESKNRFDKVLEYLTILDVDYELDSNIVRGLDYYNHTVFELVTDMPELGNASTLGAGGRYNNLVENLGGPSTPCVGWACGVDRLMIILKELNKDSEITDNVDVYVMAVNDEERLTAARLVQDLRWSELKVEYDTLDRGLKAQFKAADRINARLLVILNSEELNKGIITVKDNLTKEEVKIDENEIIDYIISNL
ncbi:MAG: histidine--tRNA ligase [Firmicutes bacterium]|nr:histidine--tRNA ligase [Bacillota bacterium]